MKIYYDVCGFIAVHCTGLEIALNELHIKTNRAGGNPLCHYTY